MKSVKLSLLCVAALVTSSFAQLVWTRATDSAGWSKRCGQGAVVFNNEMWVMGGLNSGLDANGRSQQDVWHSSDGVNWSLATDSAGWTRRVLPTCLAFANKMWIIGGIAAGAESGTSTLTHDVWSTTDGVHWTLVTDSAPWHVRIGQAGVVFDSMIWVMGGADSFSNNGPQQKVNDVWNSSDGVHWTRVTAAAQWSARDGHAAVAPGGKIWVLGGEETNGDSSDVWSTTNGTAWSEATANPGWGGRAFTSVLPFNDKIWVMGGTGSFNPIYGDVWYSANGTQWTEDASQAPWRARYGQAAVDFNNRMWVMGGCDSAGVRNDVWYSAVAGVAEGPTSDVGRNVELFASPNPFRGRTELACSRTRNSPASIWIQDVSGRRIRELAANSPETGFTSVVWDGRDAAGKDAPAGVYLALVSTGGRTDETMVVKLR